VMPPTEPDGSGRKVWLGILIGVLAVAILGAGGYLLAQALNKDDTPTQVAVARVEGMKYDDAVNTLDGQGLLASKQPKETDQYPPNTVISQDPLPDTLVQVGSTVELTVAVRPAQVAVPDLSCMTLDAATTSLTAVDLKLGTKTTTTSDACPPNTI